MELIRDPGSAQALRVLLIEDSAADAELTEWRLREAGFELRARRVVSEDELQAALAAHSPELILSDFSLPGFDGMAALAIARRAAPDVPFIFLSGTIGEERAIEALKCGATDYVLKSNLARLVPAVQRALQEAALRRSSQVAEQRVVRLSGVLQMLSGINSALLRIADRDEVLAETCRLAHEVGGYAFAMLALINPSARSARQVAWAGHKSLARPQGELIIADDESHDTSLVSRVLRTGQAVLCEDLKRFPAVVGRRVELEAADVRSLACLPLRVDNTPVGALVCGTRGAAFIGPDELLLLEEVASNLSFALQYLDKRDALHFLSYFEPLTGLAKRALFCERLSRVLLSERLSRMLKRGPDSQPHLAVTVFDLTHLSVINAAHGRHNGDRLLQCVADRLKSHFPDSEQLAHLGGGTFACVHVLRGHGEDEILAAHEVVAQLLAAPFHIERRDLSTEIRCGIACYPEDGSEPNELVQNAEAALKQARSLGERCLHHRSEMNSGLARRVGMEQRLRTALERGQFLLHYQPKIALRSGRITSVEALLRWNDPQNGLTAPQEFLPLLETNGLMSETGAWVLRQAVADCRAWRRLGLPPLRVAVNISLPELRQPDIVEQILGVVGELADAEPWGIDLEITEGALSGDSYACVQALRMLRAAGMRVAIDDFGSGFSSLGRLSELPIDILKIDRMFTGRLPSDRKSCTLVSTIIGLAHAFQMTAVAEGVEEPAQLDYLVREGCDESQGFLHSRPLPREELVGWLARLAHDPRPGGGAIATTGVVQRLA
ncbi:MAG TPA: EAL domain-containing protein [Candidatus Dormibacteraeota bacterium]|nr:EAL domain-containing protein [Candidatus Dormibacteraeota bacterium]